MVFALYKNVRRNIREDGLITSSSGFLVRAMLDKIDFGRPLRILEIGSGKGAFTREIIRRMDEASELHVSEIKAEYNPWIERLIAANPGKRVQLYNGCVTDLLNRRNEYDVIVSSLPLKNFERMDDGGAFLERVIEGFEASLKEGGSYLQYQYFRSNKGDIERIFGKRMDESIFVPLNIPPAFVYNMTKGALPQESRDSGLLRESEAWTRPEPS